LYCDIYTYIIFIYKYLPSALVKQVGQVGAVWAKNRQDS